MIIHYLDRKMLMFKPSLIVTIAGFPEYQAQIYYINQYYHIHSYNYFNNTATDMVKIWIQW